MALNKWKDTGSVDAIITELESVEQKSQVIWGNGNVLLRLTSPRKALGYKVRWYLKPTKQTKGAGEEGKGTCFEQKKPI